MGGTVLCFFFFFKQKTAYEMLRSLVGSEMCIRDRGLPDAPDRDPAVPQRRAHRHRRLVRRDRHGRAQPCLLYTSDAADDLLCVDLGGRRIIKKKTTKTTCNSHNPTH